MKAHGWAIVAGVVMIVGGLVLFFAFQDVQTPVVGLRQAGAVIAALGVIELAVTTWSILKSRGQHGR